MGVAEFVLELWLFPWLKRQWLVCAVGVAVMCGGQALRSLAMWTAGVSFTHMVADRKRPEHRLVTHGVYRWVGSSFRPRACPAAHCVCASSHFRHPSYTGWFYWSVATQLVLCNPVSSVLYAIAAYRFFADRIPDEERGLIAFFGPQYRAYARRTHTWLPGIPGVAHKGGGADGAAE